MKREIIETKKVLSVENLIEVLQSFSVTDPAKIFVKGTDGYDVRVSLEETTLTDGSIVYDVIFSEDRSADDKAVL